MDATGFTSKEMFEVSATCYELSKTANTAEGAKTCIDSGSSWLLAACLLRIAEAIESKSA
jgi:hypothetical protein